jgi:hypothetical protein
VSEIEDGGETWVSLEEDRGGWGGPSVTVHVHGDVYLKRAREQHENRGLVTLI